MLSLFRQGIKKDAKSQKQGHAASRPRVPIQPRSAAAATQEMMSTADRETYQFEMPEQELGLSDLIRDHTPGNRFKYVAITGKDSEQEEARLRRIFSLRPKMKTNLTPLNDIPEVKLIDNETSFPMDKALTKLKLFNYVRISDIAGYFSPLNSVTSEFTKVKISLMDNRSDPPMVVQCVTANTNTACKFNLSMDYCVPHSDVPLLSVSIAREVPLSSGYQWASIQVQIQIQDSDFPNQYPLKPVVAVLAPTATAMEEYTVNPNFIDVTMMGSDIKKIRDLYQRGEIADEGAPIKAIVKKATYSKSTIRGLPKGDVVNNEAFKNNDWDFLNGSIAKQIEADQVSTDPEEEGDSSENDDVVLNQTAKEWQREQERMRKEMDVMSTSTEEIVRSDSHARNFSGSTYSGNEIPPGFIRKPEPMHKSAMKKQVAFNSLLV